MYHVDVNVNLMEEKVLQIKSGITTINVEFGILLHVAVKMVNIKQVLLMIQ